MLIYLLARLVFAIVVVWGAATIAFVLIEVVPTDPARAALGVNADEVMVQNYRHEVGLDQPIGVQYEKYLIRLAHGDFGTSIVSHTPVTLQLRQYIPATVELILASICISQPLALVLGILAAVHKGGAIDSLSRFVSVAGMSMPVFWYGLILQLVFYGWLGVLPAGGRLDTGLTRPPTVTGMYTFDAAIAGDWQAFGSATVHLILPAFSLAFLNVAAISRMTRSTMLQVLRQAYVRTARSKGLSRSRVVLKHALRNALIPVITESGLRIGGMFGGAVLTETVFAWPGIGKYTVFSIIQGDIPVVIAATLWAAAAFSAVNLLVDFSYPIIDPRIAR